MVDVPDLANSPFSNPAAYPRVTPDVAFPTLGVVVGEVTANDSIFTVSLTSTYPNHQRFERRTAGSSWQSVSTEDVLPVGACRVEYRSIDETGTVSATSIVDVWAPRIPEFLTESSLSSVRQQSRLCP